jgi:hypothetical protein
MTRLDASPRAGESGVRTAGASAQGAARGSDNAPAGWLCCARDLKPGRLRWLSNLCTGPVTRCPCRGAAGKRARVKRAACHAEGHDGGSQPARRTRLRSCSCGPAQHLTRAYPPMSLCILIWVPGFMRANCMRTTLVMSARPTIWRGGRAEEYTLCTQKNCKHRRPTWESCQVRVKGAGVLPWREVHSEVEAKARPGEQYSTADLLEQRLNDVREVGVVWEAVHILCALRSGTQGRVACGGCEAEARAAPHRALQPAAACAARSCGAKQAQRAGPSCGLAGGATLARSGEHGLPGLRRPCTAPPRRA